MIAEIHKITLVKINNFKITAASRKKEGVELCRLYPSLIFVIASKAVVVYSRSKMPAAPCPPPMHIVTMP